MFCKSCGHEIGSNDSFCPYCGARVDNYPASPTNPGATQPVSGVAPAYTPNQAPKSSPAVPILVGVCSVLAMVIIGLVLVRGGIINIGGDQPTAVSASPEATSDAVSTTEEAKTKTKDEDEVEDSASNSVASEQNSSESVSPVTNNITINTSDSTPTPTVVTSPTSSTTSSTPTETTTSSSSGSITGFIIPDSSERYLSTSELSAYSDWDLYIARNEIYARHGRGFKRQNLRDYFNNCSWYTQIYTPDEFDNYHEGELSDVEWTNIMTILDLEHARNSPYP